MVRRIGAALLGALLAALPAQASEDAGIEAFSLPGNLGFTAGGLDIDYVFGDVVLNATMSGDTLTIVKQISAGCAAPTWNCRTETVTVDLGGGLTEDQVDARIAPYARVSPSGTINVPQLPSANALDSELPSASQLLPNVSAANNGSILKVTNGIWALGIDQTGSGGGGLTEDQVNALIAPYARATPSGTIGEPQLPVENALDEEAIVEVNDSTFNAGPSEADYDGRRMIRHDGRIFVADINPNAIGRSVSFRTFTDGTGHFRGIFANQPSTIAVDDYWFSVDQGIWYIRESGGTVRLHTSNPNFIDGYYPTRAEAEAAVRGTDNVVVYPNAQGQNRAHQVTGFVAGTASHLWRPVENPIHATAPISIDPDDGSIGIQDDAIEEAKLAPAVRARFVDLENVPGDLLPHDDNTGNVGNATRTWASGRFQTLAVEGAVVSSGVSIFGGIQVSGELDANNDIHLGDRDQLILGTGRDATFDYDDRTEEVEIVLQPTAGAFTIHDGSTERFVFNRDGTTNLITDAGLNVGTPANESTTVAASRQAVAEAIAANAGSGGGGSELFYTIADANVGGTGDAITLATGESLSAVQDGSIFVFESKAANTGPVTVSVDGNTALSVQRSNGNGGSTALTGGEFTASDPIILAYQSSFGGILHWIPGHMGLLARLNEIGNDELASALRDEIAQGGRPIAGLRYVISEAATTPDAPSARWNGNIYQAHRDMTVRGFSYYRGAVNELGIPYAGACFDVSRSGATDYRTSTVNLWNIRLNDAGTWHTNEVSIPDNQFGELELRAPGDGFHVDRDDYFACMAFFRLASGQTAISTGIVGASDHVEMDHADHSFNENIMSYVARASNNRADRFFSNTNIYNNSTHSIRQQILYDALPTQFRDGVVDRASCSGNDLVLERSEGLPNITAQDACSGASGGGSGEANVQADWDETDTASDAFIRNKPTTITAVQTAKLASIENGAEVNERSDWDQTTQGDDSFILNKPPIPTSATLAPTPAGDIALTLGQSGGGSDITATLDIDGSPPSEHPRVAWDPVNERFRWDRERLLLLGMQGQVPFQVNQINLGFAADNALNILGGTIVTDPGSLRGTVTIPDALDISALTNLPSSDIDDTDELVINDESVPEHKKITIGELAARLADGTTITSSGGTLTAVGGSGGGTVAFSGALVDRTADQSITNATTIAAQAWNNEEFDEGGWHSSSNPTRLTVPSGVDYVRVSCSIRYENVSNAAQVLAQLRMNGTHSIGMPQATSLVATPATSGDISVTSAVVEVDAGDYFECMRQSNDSAVTVATESWFGIVSESGGSGGSGTADGVADSVDLAVSGNDLTVTVGRTEGADLTDTVTLPSGGGTGEAALQILDGARVGGITNGQDPVRHAITAQFEEDHLYEAIFTPANAAAAHAVEQFTGRAILALPTVGTTTVPANLTDAIGLKVINVGTDTGRTSFGHDSIYIWRADANSIWISRGRSVEGTEIDIWRLPSGPAGQGVPTGGADGQILAKASATNFDTEWIDAPTGGTTDLQNIAGNLLPDADNARSVGTEARTWNTARFRTMVVEGATTVGGIVVTGDLDAQNDIHLGDRDQLILGTDRDAALDYDDRTEEVELRLNSTVDAFIIHDGTTARRFEFGRDGTADFHGDLTVDGLTLGTQDMADACVDVSVAGTTLTCTQADGTVETAQLPTTGGGGSDDGVINGLSGSISGRTITFTASRTVGGDVSGNVQIPEASSSTTGLARQASDAEVSSGANTNHFIATSQVDNLSIASTQVTGLPSTIGDITEVVGGAGLTATGCDSGSCSLAVTPNDADFPTIPIGRGGTNATSVGTARTNLGLNDACVDIAYAGTTLTCTQADGGTDTATITAEATFPTTALPDDIAFSDRMLIADSSNSFAQNYVTMTEIGDYIRPQVLDEGTDEVTGLRFLNFEGDGVSVTPAGRRANVVIPGAATWARSASPSGSAPANRVGSGTPSETTWLRGDGAWRDLDEIEEIHYVQPTHVSILGNDPNHIAIDNDAGIPALTNGIIIDFIPEFANTGSVRIRIRGTDYTVQKSGGASALSDLEADDWPSTLPVQVEYYGAQLYWIGTVIGNVARRNTGTGNGDVPVLGSGGRLNPSALPTSLLGHHERTAQMAGQRCYSSDIAIPSSGSISITTIHDSTALNTATIVIPASVLSGLTSYNETTAVATNQSLRLPTTANSTEIMICNAQGDVGFGVPTTSSNDGDIDIYVHRQ